VLATAQHGVAIDSPLIGVLFTASGVGALAATFLLSRIAGWLGPERLTLVGLTLVTALLPVLAFAPSFATLVGLFVAWGAISTAVIVNGISVRQMVTPDDMQGKVNTVGRMLTFGAGQPAGAAAAGLLAAHLGVTGALAVMAAPTAVAAVAGWTWYVRSHRP
jgi:predicted MFS family arabinose efflux permease